MDFSLKKNYQEKVHTYMVRKWSLRKKALDLCQHREWSVCQLATENCREIRYKNVLCLLYQIIWYLPMWQKRKETTQQVIISSVSLRHNVGRNSIEEPFMVVLITGKSIFWWKEMKVLSNPLCWWERYHKTVPVQLLQYLLSLFLTYFLSHLHFPLFASLISFQFFSKFSSFFFDFSESSHRSMIFPA